MIHILFCISKSSIGGFTVCLMENTQKTHRGTQLELWLMDSAPMYSYIQAGSLLVVVAVALVAVVAVAIASVVVVVVAVFL